MPTPTKFSPEVAAVILTNVRAGNFRVSAAKAAGVDQKTLRTWLHQADKQRDGAPLKVFAKALRKAEAQAECLDIARIGIAGKEDWRAIAWRRERMQPSKYGLRVKVEVDRELNGMLDKLQRALPEDLYERVITALAVDSDEPDAPGDVPFPALSAGEGAAGGAVDGEFFDAE